VNPCFAIIDRLAITLDNTFMASTAARIKQTRGKARNTAVKRPARRLSNASLLKLAAKRRPPQRWYDEQTDPTKPEPSRTREH
jgi:hypothetical protein